MVSYIKKAVLAFLILFSIFIISLLLASLIPSRLLKNNITLSLVTLNKEGTYPSIGPIWRSIVLDNYTDPLILNTAYSVNPVEPLESSLLNYRYMESPEQFNQIINLEKTVQSKAPTKVAYERYWHGYLAYLRPLLVLFSYSQIRFIINLFLFGGLFILLYKIRKEAGLLKAVIFLFAMFAVDYFHLGRSIQFSNVFLVGIFSSIYLLSIHKKNVNNYTLFFIVGALTSYFDLLTAPLVSLGILLIVELFLENRGWLKIIKNSFSWSFGYLSLWASKWVVVTVLYAPGSIFTSLAQVVNRTVTIPDNNFSYLKTLRLNIFQLIGYHKSNKVFFLAVFLALLILSIKYFKFSKVNFKRITSWLIISIIPYLWYLIAANHSYLHVWYTYRNQFMSVVAGFMIVYELTNVRLKKSASNRSNKRLNKIR
ncbi:MAG: hypothetical protein UR68_C0027G0009 [Candidatus Roizmanbacteria bacterium GW2011_GWA2_35_19]|uniref:Glycosyltransferase RgtA/B/C/D-like domain-containing protein n=2 Tax=Candidatus Roizmaniibacteriota TaxID=1752723 RepID=A0A0G0BQK5_9BACT|nr:MAG: hypothetical protein UR68_C0027G0009 [Candidatus Roizmanbacteria bacterium GW2011_GWA2_35_19]